MVPTGSGLLPSPFASWVHLHSWTCPLNDRNQSEMTGSQPCSSPLSKGSENHLFPKERRPQGPLPSLGLAVDMVLLPEKVPGLNEDYKGFRAESLIYICSLYKTEPGVKHHAQQPPQSINHRTPETMKQILPWRPSE